MKLLIIGAGVLGSFYAARLKKSGQDVTILARGKRAEQLREFGIVIKNEHGELQSVTHLPVIEKIEPQEEYDLALVLVRKNQVADLLPDLTETAVKAFVFMVNNAAGPQAYIDAVGEDRVILGFPGAGGRRTEDGEIWVSQTSGKTQPTTIGELNGQRSERILELALALHDAGLPVEICHNMDAWLKTHVALVSPIANALYLADGDPYRLANTRDGLLLMVRAIREGLHVLNHLEIPVTPAKYHFVLWVPERILVAVLKKGLATPRAELVLAAHARAARDEMQQLALEFQQLALEAGVPTPNIDNLVLYLNPQTRPLPTGSEKLNYTYHDWKPLVIGVALLGFILGLVLRKKRK